MEVAITLIIDNLDWASVLNCCTRTILLLEPPGAPAVAFLQWSVGKFRKTHSDWVGESDILNIELF